MQTLLAKHAELQTSRGSYRIQGPSNICLFWLATILFSSLLLNASSNTFSKNTHRWAAELPCPQHPSLPSEILIGRTSQPSKRRNVGSAPGGTRPTSCTLFRTTGPSAEKKRICVPKYLDSSAGRETRRTLSCTTEVAATLFQHHHKPLTPRRLVLSPRCSSLL